DAKFGSRMHLSAGGRVDNYSTIGSSFNPRVGFVAQPYERGNTKLTVGRAFRAPSAYELYYNDEGRTQLPARPLRPETIWSAEIEHSHRFTSTVVGSAAVYGSAIRDLIDAVPAQTRQANLSPQAQGGEAVDAAPQNREAFQFGNTPLPIVAVGTEIGLRREWRSGWMASLYYGYTRTRFVSDGRMRSLLMFDQAKTVRHVANSPVHSATFKGVAPFLIRGLSMATRVTLEDARWDRNESLTDEPQQRTSAAVFWDLVLTAEDPKHHLNFAVGIYNLFDWRYAYPLGRESSFQRTIASNGRTLLASVETHF
ncbi:MAG TPA: TonB-dependent receptor, partial [Polyangiaceae bacterium]